MMSVDHRVSAITQMERHRLLERLLLHGALWITVVTALDVGTSWLMMSLRGVTSEGNATMRLLFQNQDLSTFVIWLFQQYVYIGFGTVSVFLYLVVRYASTVVIIQGAARIVVLVTWFFSFLRLYYGPPGNTITLLLPNGDLVALGGGALLFFVVLWVMISDMQFTSIVRGILRPGMLSQDSHMRAILDAISVPDAQTSKAALSLAEEATIHLKGAQKLYAEHLYGDSVYLLQQSVESSVKCTALLLGTIQNNPNLIERTVGHQSSKALLLGIPHLVEMITQRKQLLSQIKTADVLPSEKLKGPFRRFDKNVLQKFAAEPLPPFGDIQREANEAINLTDREMWAPTLQLDRMNKWVNIALNGLESKPIVSRNTQSATRFASAGMSFIGLFNKVDSRKVRFINWLADAFGDALWLSLLLDWHWKSTRYPPLRVNEYWSEKAYTSEQPLVRETPRLFEYAYRLSNGGLQAAKAALEYSNIVP